MKLLLSECLLPNYKTLQSKH